MSNSSAMLGALIMIVVSLIMLGWVIYDSAKTRHRGRHVR